MYTFEYLGIPEKKEDLDSIFDLLCVCNADFVPPLTERVSSVQKHFGDTQAEEKPYSYFEIMRQQHFTCARDESGKMVAFLTFRPKYVCDELAVFGLNNYMTTACVYHEHRGHGLVSGLYTLVESGLPEEMRTEYTTTRTWSTNLVQMHAFPKRGYEIVATLKDDRGPGVDTVYFCKRNSTDAE